VGVGGPGGEQHVASASRGLGDRLLCEEEWEGLADRVLVDAPCSNSGVMRRRVDLRCRIETCTSRFTALARFTYTYLYLN
jgi:16S rRNA C967 or C1407 C5-methylase (RsmB/RsmF family)